MATYDKYYETEALFGEPYPELIAFFKSYAHKGKVLDIGCGQGRNAIALAMLGYEVTGIDISQVGISQMLHLAVNEHLPVKGIVTDLYSYNDFTGFDVVLLDSMFHFSKRYKEREVAFIERMIYSSQAGTLFVFCIQNMKHKVAVLKRIISNNAGIKEVLCQVISYSFPGSGSTDYLMLAIRK